MSRDPGKAFQIFYEELEELLVVRTPYIVKVVVAFILIGVLGLSVYSHSIREHNRDLEDNAKRVLRAYGEAQLAYEMLVPPYFADWETLQDYSFVSKDVGRSDLIEDYSLWTRTDNVTDRMMCDFGGTLPENSFVVVAFPTPDHDTVSLRTFGMWADVVLRVYDPESGSEPWDEDRYLDVVKTWEPIR